MGFYVCAQDGGGAQKARQISVMPLPWAYFCRAFAFFFLRTAACVAVRIVHRNASRRAVRMAWAGFGKTGRLTADLLADAGGTAAWLSPVYGRVCSLMTHLSS